jgi:FtsH-binding integral membrane protein
MQSAMAFAETRVRNGFVRKVFGIVTIQLLITVGFAAACMYVPEINVSGAEQQLRLLLFLVWVLRQCGAGWSSGPQCSSAAH